MAAMVRFQGVPALVRHRWRASDADELLVKGRSAGPTAGGGTATAGARGSRMGANTLLAYVSSGGATEGYARIIADTLRDHGYLLDIVDLRRDRVRDLSPYRNVILGTGVRIGMIYRKGKKFLRRKDLARKRLAVFLSSGIAVEDAVRSKEKFLDPMIRKYGLRPVLYDALPGKLPGPNNTLEDKTDAGLARQWAEELAIRLRDGG